MHLRLAALFASCVLVSSWAGARTTHVVRHGQTLGGIALEYRTTVRELVAANPRLKSRPLRAGQSIVVPGHDDGETKHGKTAGTSKPGAEKGSRWSSKPKHPGVVHLSRLATTEDAIVTVRDRGGRVPKAAHPVFARMLRAKNGATHAIDPRLIALVGIVSDHFGGRRLEVISGYRPYTPKQHTAHSNHNIGHAMDFRVIGVPNEVVRDFCRTLRNVGVGYYPNSVFVHLDARHDAAFWVDYSRPGEPPRYGEGGVDPDEGASDVSEDNPLVGKLGSETTEEVKPTSTTGEVPKAPPSENAGAAAPKRSEEGSTVDGANN